MVGRHGGAAATWKQIADGELDESVIDVQARRVKEYGEKVFLSFDLEMDTRTPDNGTPETTSGPTATSTTGSGSWA